MSGESCEGTDAAGWVLGALSDQETERFAAHLRDCPSCRAEVGRLTEASERLLEATPRVAPRAELRDRVLAAVQMEASLFEAAGAVSVEPRPRLARSRRRIGLLVGIAVAAIALAGVLVWGGSGHLSDTRTVLGHVTLPGGGPRARAVVSIGPHGAALVVADLAVPPPGQVYQAWVLRPGSPAVPTGALFSVPGSGDTRVLLPSLARVAQVIITAEPPGGSPAPSLPAIVVVDLQSAGPARASQGVHA